MRCTVCLILVVISGLYLSLVRILSNAILYKLGRDSILERSQGQRNSLHQSICLSLVSKIPRGLGAWEVGAMEGQRDRERKTVKCSTNLISKCIGNKNKRLIRIDILCL